MSNYFYLTRNFFGLLFVISPLSGFLWLEQDLFLYTFFFIGLFLGLPLAYIFNQKLPFSIWILLFSVCACAGFFFTYQSVSFIPRPYCSILWGVGSSGLLLFLPSEIIIFWFRFSKTEILGITWTSGLFLGFLWKLALSYIFYPAFLLSILSIILGTLAFLEAPLPLFYDEEESFCETAKEFYAKRKKSSSTKSFFFFLTISFCNGVALCLFSNQGDFLLPGRSFLPFLLGIILGPLFCSMFIQRQGIFPTCVFLIFAAQSALLCVGAAQTSFWNCVFGTFVLGFGCSAIFLVIPICTYYLNGPFLFSRYATKNFFSVPLGFLFAFLGYRVQLWGDVRETEPYILIMILLILGYLMIFSAWKNRFILLKI